METKTERVRSIFRESNETSCVGDFGSMIQFNAPHVQVQARIVQPSVPADLPIISASSSTPDTVPPQQDLFQNFQLQGGLKGRKSHAKISLRLIKIVLLTFSLSLAER